MPTKKRKIYGKPLLSERIQRDKENLEYMKQKALKKLGPIAIEEIKNELDRHSFDRPPTNLKESFSYEIKGSQLVIKSDHPAATFLEEGVEEHQMDYLTKSPKPIPIMKDNGEVIFRKATPQTMADGKWFHPGINGMNFIEKAIQDARQRVKSEMNDEYREFIKQKIEEKLKDKLKGVRKK